MHAIMRFLFPVLLVLGGFMFISLPRHWKEVSLLVLGLSIPCGIALYMDTQQDLHHQAVVLADEGLYTFASIDHINGHSGYSERERPGCHYDAAIEPNRVLARHLNRHPTHIRVEVTDADLVCMMCEVSEGSYLCHRGQRKLTATLRR